MPTSLTAGSIAFTGFNGSGNDNLSFVVLTDITANTVITFTDNTWNGTSFASGSNAESIFTWTATSDVAAGTVIDLNNLKNGNASASASVGVVNFTNSANLGLSNDNETVYAYTGSASSPNFLAAITNIGFTGSNGTAYGVLTNTGLTAGVNAVAFSGGVDTVGYTGMRTGETQLRGLSERHQQFGELERGRLRSVPHDEVHRRSASSGADRFVLTGDRFRERGR